MKPIHILLFSAVLSGMTAFAASTKDVARDVDVKSVDGTVLKGTYFAVAKPGPGVLLFHQSNRTRKSWDELATQLTTVGIHVLTVDSRAHGESSGKYDTEANRTAYWKTLWPSDLDAAFQYLSSQAGVNREEIGAGGAGNLGVQSAIEIGRRHPTQVQSLVLLSGETVRSGMQFLRHASQLPQLYVMDDNDEYPPTQEEMKLLYITASSPIKKLVHYSQAEDAPWLWYETFLDNGKVPAKGGHGTDMFKPHPELPGIIVDWFKRTLLRTPAPRLVDTLASAQVLNQLNFGGIAEVKQQLLEARKTDPEAQLFPEVTAESIGEDFQRDGDAKTALEVFKLVEIAYPQSADVQSDLADAYLANGEKDMAREHSQRALSLLDSHAAPASSWSDTEERRGEIRKAAEETLKKASGK